MLLRHILLLLLLLLSVFVPVDRHARSVVHRSLGSRQLRLLESLSEVQELLVVRGADVPLWRVRVGFMGIGKLSDVSDVHFTEVVLRPVERLYRLDTLQLQRGQVLLRDHFAVQVDLSHEEALFALLIVVHYNDHFNNSPRKI